MSNFKHTFDEINSELVFNDLSLDNQYKMYAAYIEQEYVGNDLFSSELIVEADKLDEIPELLARMLNKKILPSTFAYNILDMVTHYLRASVEEAYNELFYQKKDGKNEAALYE